MNKLYWDDEKMKERAVNISRMLAKRNKALSIAFFSVYSFIDNINSRHQSNVDKCLKVQDERGKLICKIRAYDVSLELIENNLHQCSKARNKKHCSEVFEEHIHIFKRKLNSAEKRLNKIDTKNKFNEGESKMRAIPKTWKSLLEETDQAIMPTDRDEIDDDDDDED